MDVVQGSGERPTAARFEEWLTQLRSLPAGIGAITYLASFGEDYAALKRAVHPVDPPPA